MAAASLSSSSAAAAADLGTKGKPAQNTNNVMEMLMDNSTVTWCVEAI